MGRLDNYEHIFALAPRPAEKLLTNWTAAAQNLFIVTGGPIRVISIFGEVQVTLKATPMNLSLVAAVTTPSGNVDIASALDCNADAKGTLYKLNTTFGGTMVAVTAGITDSPWTEFIMPTGTINMTSSAVEDGGGSILWRMTYQPLTTIAVVTIA